MQKNIKNLIIESLYDGDTVESLLQEAELTLATTVTKCRSKEAAKKNQSQIEAQEQEIEAISTHNHHNNRENPAYVRGEEEHRVDSLSSL